MVDTSFWSDPWVVDQLNALDRYLFLYLITNDHINLAGVYEISLRTISYETGIEQEELLRMFKRLEPKIRYIDSWVILKNSIKNQNYHSPKIKANIEFVLSGCPPDLMDYVEWPKDYGRAKPDGSMQTSLLTDVNEFDSKNKRERDGNNVVSTDNTPVSKLTTTPPVKYPMHTVSPYNHNNNNKHNAAVAATVADKKLSKKEAAAKRRKPPPGEGYKQAAAIADEIKKRRGKP